MAALLFATYAGSRRPEAVFLRHGVTSIQGVSHYAMRRAGEGKFLRSLIDRGMLPRDLVLGVTGAGAVPYYTDWPTVDALGLNDAEIARLPLEERGVIAHEREAPYEYLVRRRVVVFDVLNQIVHRSDLAINYSLFFDRWELFYQPSVQNLFNEKAATGVNTTVLVAPGTIGDPLEPFDPFTETPISYSRVRPRRRSATGSNE